MNEESLSNNGDASIGVKKELLINNSDKVLDNLNDCAILNESVFDTIPFMAKLLENLKCSFFSEGNEIFVANIEMNSLRELFDRLDNFAINANRMECLPDCTFSLSFDIMQITNNRSTRDHLTSMRLLPWVAAAFCSHDVTLRLSLEDIQVCSVTVPILSKLMQRLKQVNMKPAAIQSSKGSLFTLIFTTDSFPNGVKTTSKNNRPKICPNYLRDYVVDKEEPSVLENKFQPIESLSMLLPNLPDDGTLPPSASENYGNICKKVRGRPRIRPLPLTDFPKRPRGRPRRSDFIPYPISPRNSFINIQPRYLYSDEFKSCFERFLESDFAKADLQ